MPLKLPAQENSKISLITHINDLKEGGKIDI